MQLHESISVSFHVLSVNIEIILCIPNTVYTKFNFGYSEKAAKEIREKSVFNSLVIFQRKSVSKNEVKVNNKNLKGLSGEI